jgi:hypothetical protein
MLFTEFEFIAVLLQLRGANIVTLQTRTVPKLLAKHAVTAEPNPFKGNVVKLASVNGVIGWQYATAVNRQREREELPTGFRAEKRDWGTRLHGTPLVRHKSRYYVEMKVQHESHHYQTLDGRDLATEEVEAFLPKRKPSFRQGVDREIVLRDYATSSIVSLTTRGVIYTIKKTEPAAA